ncbi:hypothetical protein [Curtobacterium sp. ME26]|uniref:hypothetical protein n=1 Tax=Curtobacterium sp. ME26 TaxID=2744254 RepID=UPI0015F6A950|nr:hypothetical protein [Curtobacterium sp. ME26]
MKNKMFLTAAVTAFLIGAGAVVVAHADDADTDIVDDPGKQTALESAPEPTDVSTDVASDTSPLAPAASNQSNPNQLNLLDQQYAITEMMTGSVAAGRLDVNLLGASQDDQLAGAFSDSAVASRKKLIAYNYTATQVDSMLTTYNDGLRQAITTPDENWLFTDNKFVVTTWQGIQWNYNTGSATLIGHQSYKNPDGTWVDDADAQWRLSFNHAANEGHYHLVGYRAVPVDGVQG